jgi:hypothetical protein
MLLGIWNIRGFAAAPAEQQQIPLFEYTEFLASIVLHVMAAESSGPMMRNLRLREGRAYVRFCVTSHTSATSSLLLVDKARLERQLN